MLNILPQAQVLVNLLLSLMPSYHKTQSLQALLELFLQAQGSPLPQSCQAKSPAALSRFLNRYDWPTRTLIRQVRSHLVKTLLSHCPRGRRPHLQLIIDLTCLPKRGRFKAFSSLIRVFHRKRGLHLVILYIVVGHWRLPWGFRVYRGKGTPSPAQLGLRLLRTLPTNLKSHFRLMVLADAAFGSRAFLEGVRCLRMHALVGVSCQRCLADGRRLQQLVHRGQQVRLRGLNQPVWVSWYWLPRHKAPKQKRFVACTRALKGSTLSWWGKRRWQIEGFFKVAKHRFGLHCFGQQTLLGVYRWLVLSFIAFVLAHWGYLLCHNSETLDWSIAAQSALELFFPALVAFLLLQQLERLRPLLLAQGIDASVTYCKI